MNPSANQTTTLSKKRYAVARIVKYLQVILIIALIFIPILKITSVEETKTSVLSAEASISVYQFLTDQADATAKISYGNNSEANEFLNDLMKVEVNVTEEAFNGLPDAENIYSFVKVGILVFAFSVGFLSLLGSRAAYADPHKTYIYGVYDSLPKFFAFFETTGTILLTTTVIAFNAIGYVNAFSNDNIEWKVDFIPSVVAVVVVLLLINGAITHIICAKDIREIRTNNQKFNEPYEIASFANDLKAIGELFGANVSYNTSGQYQSTPNSTISENKITEQEISEDKIIELLQKYKLLFDSGVITKEEYQQKKDEILNTKNK